MHNYALEHVMYQMAKEVTQLVHCGIELSLLDYPWLACIVARLGAKPGGCSLLGILLFLHFFLFDESANSGICPS